MVAVGTQGVARGEVGTVMSELTPPSESPTWVLLDATAENADDPHGFPIPSDEERGGLKPGDTVKLVVVLTEAPQSGPNAERRWAEVVSVELDQHQSPRYLGRVTDDPSVVTSLRVGDPVTFDQRHVAGIAMAPEEVAFAVDHRALVTLDAAEAKVPPGWVSHDEPVADDDSGWTVCVGDEPPGIFDGDPDEVTRSLTLGELVLRHPALVEVFQAGEGDWLYDPALTRYVRVKPTSNGSEDSTPSRPVDEVDPAER